MSCRNKVFSIKSAIPTQAAKVTSFLSSGFSDSELVLSEIYERQFCLGFGWVGFFCFVLSVCVHVQTQIAKNNFMLDACLHSKILQEKAASLIKLLNFSMS